MRRKLLGICGVLLFGSFTSLSGVASANEDSLVEVPVPVEEAVNECGETPEVEPLVSNPAELQKCLTACKGGGAAMLRYCAVFLDPRIRALCIVAAGGSFVACSGFCYARFVD